MDWWKRKKSRSYEKKQRLLEDLIQCCDGKSNPFKIFSADQIIKANNNVCKLHQKEKNNVCFISQTGICEGTFVSQFPGGWYSGTLDNHRVILLVKKYWLRHPFDPKDFCPEVRDIAISSMVSGHKNFMKLVGCCLETEIPFMVYYGEKKLYSYMHLQKVVSWRKRMKIAEDIATALAYLHTAFSRPFVYSNMHLHNILLDEDGVAKLSEFSNCVSIPQGETFVKVGPRIWGTLDYMDYDYMANGVVSEKTDAFGFGIFMQKLLIGEERFHQLCDWLTWKRSEKLLFVSSESVE